MENVIEEPAIAYNRHYTEEEYLNLDWQNGERFEYWNGELVAMAGASLRHNEIVFNLTAILKSMGRGNNCKTYFSDAFLQLKNSATYLFPDVIFTCNPEDLNSEKFIQNPSIIVEVLSNSTELYDRSRKWEQYRKIKSLRYYLLVSQDDYKVEMFYRPNDLTLFTFQSFDGPDAMIHFMEWNFSISLKNIYEGITFDQTHNEALEQ